MAKEFLRNEEYEDYVIKQIMERHSNIDFDQLYNVKIDESCDYRDYFNLIKANILGIYYLDLSEEYSVLVRYDSEPGVASYILNPVTNTRIFLSNKYSNARILSFNNFISCDLPIGVRFTQNDTDIAICNMVNLLCDYNITNGYYIPYSIIKSKKEK